MPIQAYLGTQPIGANPSASTKTLGTLTLWAVGKMRWFTGPVPLASANTTYTVGTLDAEDRPIATAVIPCFNVIDKSTAQGMDTYTLTVATDGTVTASARGSGSNNNPVATPTPWFVA